MSVSVDYEARREELRRRYLGAGVPESTTGVGVNHLALICSDIERPRGIKNLGPEQVMDSMYFHDPDGALIEITRHPLRG